MKSILLAITLMASASAFAPAPIRSFSVAPSSRTALNVAEPAETSSSSSSSSSRRELLSSSAAVAASLFLAAAFPTAPAVAITDASSYATAVERLTNALSQSLGHAILVIDGMNAQAGRLGSSPHPSHPLAVLDGMNAQARRLTRDLDRSLALMDEIKENARDITISDESYRLVVGDVAHASSVLDGLVAQSKRLEGASSGAGGSIGSTDDQIIYMLGVLDGLNAQVRRMDMGETFTVLDELNAKAARALL